MWNKRNDEGYGPRPQNEPVRSAAPAGYPTTPTTAAGPVPMRDPGLPPQQPAAIGASMHIKGDIRTNEELLIDGEVEGSVESHSILTVGPNGRVRANIKAREVIVFGKVQGNINVMEKIAIREQGSLVGDIKTAGISIDDGAYFKGSIDIIRPEPKVNAKPVKTEAAEARAS
ncbi:MAG TPA: polymer-forming cytoskeletal protein [Bryobacteraceae bacterium]|nr:polymer-forming cytoskeletal protein [Bryobacteraceae bacterium]